MKYNGEYETKLVGEVDFKTDKERLDFLADLIEKGSQDPNVYSFTRQLLNHNGIESYDKAGEINAIGQWVRDNISYRNHVTGRDCFQAAKRTLALGSGDCDQVTVLTNSMLASIGIPVAMRIVSMDINKPYHHIYALAGLRKSNALSGGPDDNKWIPIDTTNKRQPIGWEPNYAKKRDFLIVWDD
mgnify:FL=1